MFGRKRRRIEELERDLEVSKGVYNRLLIRHRKLVKGVSELIGPLVDARCELRQTGIEQRTTTATVEFSDVFLIVADVEAIAEGLTAAMLRKIQEKQLATSS